METVHSLVSIVFVCKDGLIVMKRRDDDRLEPGVWAGPIGDIENGESPDAAALRELKEETGIQAAPEELKFFNESELSISDRNGKRHILRFRRYAYRLPDTMTLENIRLDPKEHTEKRIVNLDELNRCYKHPHEFKNEFSEPGAKFIHDNYFRILSLCQNRSKNKWKAHA